MFERYPDFGPQPPPWIALFLMIALALVIFLVGTMK